MDGTDGIHGMMAWKLWENGVNHINRSMRVKDLPIDLRELFEPEDFDMIQCIGMEKKQIGGITVENCCNCHNQQS